MSLSDVQDPGTGTSTSPLAPASDFFEKRAFREVHFSFHLPEWAS